MFFRNAFTMSIKMSFMYSEIRIEKYRAFQYFECLLQVFPTLITRSARLGFHILQSFVQFGDAKVSLLTFDKYKILNTLAKDRSRTGTLSYRLRCFGTLVGTVSVFLIWNKTQKAFAKQIEHKSTGPKKSLMTKWGSSEAKPICP